jgi:transposase InsO family protein
LKSKYPLTWILEVLGLPSSTYNDWLHPITSKRQIQDEKLTQIITEVWLKSDKNYGSHRLLKNLKENQKLHIGLNRVVKLMKLSGIKSEMVLKFTKPKTKVVESQLPNLIKLDKPSYYWTTDITYIQLTNKKWVYLSSVFDPINHKVIAFKVANHMTTDLVLDTLRSAFSTKGVKPKYLHSDMGSQYTSLEVENFLKSKSIKHSYSLKGYPYDNAYIESFHSILKRELIYRRKYQSLFEVIASVTNYIRWFNTDRISLVA